MLPYDFSCAEIVWYAAINDFTRRGQKTDCYVYKIHRDAYIPIQARVGVRDASREATPSEKQRKGHCLVRPFIRHKLNEPNHL